MLEFTEFKFRDFLNSFIYLILTFLGCYILQQYIYEVSNYVLAIQMRF